LTVLTVPGFSSFASVASTCAISKEAITVATSPINTVGANLIVVAIAYQNWDASDVPVLSNGYLDPVSGVYVPAASMFTPITTLRTGPWALQLLSSYNPVFTDALHIFLLSPGRYVPSICVWAFSGATIGLDPGKYNGTTYSGGSVNTNTIQTGSITPGANGELIITAVNQGETTCDSSIAVSSPSFTGIEQVPVLSVYLPNPLVPTLVPICQSADSYFPAGPTLGLAMAYYVQTTAAAIDPTWSWTFSSNQSMAAIAAFK
jgi:hypothetical protein